MTYTEVLSELEKSHRVIAYLPSWRGSYVYMKDFLLVRVTHKGVILPNPYEPTLSETASKNWMIHGKNIHS